MYVCICICVCVCAREKGRGTENLIPKLHLIIKKAFIDIYLKMY